MKKQAKDLKKGDKVKIADQEAIVQETELSEIGKHGKRKCRIIAITSTGQKIIIIRPEDYVFDSQ